MENLKISIIQSDLVWENPTQNRQNFEHKIALLGETDVIVLPEMFTTGFTMNAATQAEKPDGDTFAWLQQMASTKNAAITGSFIVENQGNYYNRMFWVNPNGSFSTYDKHHTFTLAGEDKTYTAGNRQVVVDYKNWKIALFVCYDLRFPVWVRNTNARYDMAIFVASWPDRRNFAWKTLLAARAIENMAYVVGVNRVGTDTDGLKYSGNSAIYDGLGKQLTNLKEYTEGIETVQVSKTELIELRKKLNFLADADNFELKL